MQLWLRDHPQRDALGSLPEGVELHLIRDSGPLPEEIAAAEFLVPPHRPGGVLDLLPRMEALRVLQTPTSGVEWVLPLVPPGVMVCSARGTRDAAVAEWVLTMVLATLKDIQRFWNRQAERVWKTSMATELFGRRALIVGYGSIGRAVEARLLPFGVEVTRVDRESGSSIRGVGELPELLPAADVVVLLVPQTDETTRLFDARMLARMKRGALLVNACRGGVVDTDALLENLEAERLVAALDVTAPEPLPPDHPLWRAPGLLLTPHIAGDSPEAERRIYRLVGQQIRRYLAGRPLLNVVERDSPHTSAGLSQP